MKLFVDLKITPSLLPVNNTGDADTPTCQALQKKTCKSAVLWRVWSASRRALNLEHSPAHQFACCQWQQGNRPATAYLIYRWLLFIFVLSVAISSFACQQLPKPFRHSSIQLNYMKWFIYFTNWGYIFIVVQSGLALAVVYRYRADKFSIQSEDEDSAIPQRFHTPLLCRAYWITHIVATDLAFVITLVYWTLVHDPQIHEVNALNLLVHAGNSVIMLAELLVTSHPLRPAQALYGACAGLAYGVFSAIYWALGGTDRIGLTAMYPPLDWDKPDKALGFVALCAVVLLAVHMVGALVSALRLRLAQRLVPARPALPTH